MVRFKKFRIGDIFEKINAPYLGKGNKADNVSKIKNNEFCIPVVYAKRGDNGIMYWGRKGEFTTYSNVISIVYNGAVAAGLVYAQEEETGILAESYFIKFKKCEVSFKINLYFKTVIEKVIYPKYSRDELATWTGKVENDLISLPINENNEIDLDYMHNYISELEKERISELEKYLILCGLDDYKLTNEERDITLNQIKTKKFKIGDLFIVKGNPQLNKDSFEFSNDGEYPYFTRTVLNNGIAGYVNYLDEEHKIKGNSIAVGMLGMEFFYMSKDFYAGQFTKTIYPKFNNFNEEIALYFIALFNKKSEIFKSVLVRDFEKTFLNDEIELPVQNNKIDFEYIQKFIKIQQKLSIKDVIDFKDKILNMT